MKVMTIFNENLHTKKYNICSQCMCCVFTAKLCYVLQNPLSHGKQQILHPFFLLLSGFRLLPIIIIIVAMEETFKPMVYSDVHIFHEQRLFVCCYSFVYRLLSNENCGWHLFRKY